MLRLLVFALAAVSFLGLPVRFLQHFYLRLHFCEGLRRGTARARALRSRCKCGRTDISGSTNAAGLVRGLERQRHAVFAIRAHRASAVAAEKRNFTVGRRLNGD